MKKIILILILSTLTITNQIFAESNFQASYKEGYEAFQNKNYEKALIIWEKVIEKGEEVREISGATMMIGFLYEKGLGVSQDIIKALKYYNNSIKLDNNPSAKLCISVLYLNGIPPIKQDLKKAYDYIHDIENFDDDIIISVAYKFYLEGWGTPVNFKRAYEIASKITDEKERNEILEEIKLKENESKILHAKELIAEVKKNQLRFDKKYKNKTFACKGFVGNIEEQKNGYKLSLYGENFLFNPFDYIHCNFNQDQENNLLELNKNDFVKIEGTYKGKQDFQIGAIILFDCKIIK